MLVKDLKFRICKHDNNSFEYVDFSENTQIFNPLDRLDLCSGYKDKNNKLIYANDILRLTNKDKRNPYDEIVKVRCDKHLNFLLEYKDKQIQNTLSHAHFSFNIEKIGVDNEDRNNK